MDYKAYLTRIVELTRRISGKEIQGSYPSSINSVPLRALYDNLMEPQALAVHEPLAQYGTPSSFDPRAEQVLALDRAIRNVKKADWRGNRFKEREVLNAIKSKLGDDEDLASKIFEIVKAQREY